MEICLVCGTTPTTAASSTDVYGHCFGCGRGVPLDVWVSIQDRTLDHLAQEYDRLRRDKRTLEDVWTRQQQDDAEEINDLMAQVDDLRALLRSVRPVLEAEAVGWSVPEKALLREINAALGESDRPIPD